MLIRALMRITHMLTRITRTYYTYGKYTWVRTRGFGGLFVGGGGWDSLQGSPGGVLLP